MLLIVGNVVFYILARMAMMSQLFDISRSRPESFEALGVERGLVIVHTIESWRDYGTLLMLTPPFADSDLILVISRVSGENESLIQSNSDRPIYHYYPDEPSILYDSPRYRINGSKNTHKRQHSTCHAENVSGFKRIAIFRT